MVWVVEGGGLEAPSWVFGALGASDPRVREVPAEVRGALEVADVVVFQTDAQAREARGELGDPALQAALAPMLNDVPVLLPEGLERRLSAYCAAVGLERESVRVYEAWFLALLLPSMAERAWTGSEESVTDRVYEAAVGAGVQVGSAMGLEEELGALARLDTLPWEAQLEGLEGVLATLEQAQAQGRSPMEREVAAYVAGGVEATKYGEAQTELERRCAEEVLEGLRLEVESRVLQALATEPGLRFVFVVDVVFVGEGLLETLRDYGYTVRRARRGEVP